MQRRHAKRTAGAGLRVGNCLERAAEILGKISGIVEGNADQQRRKRIEVDAEIAEPEMGHVDLEERRRIAGNLDPGRSDARQQAAAGEPKERKRYGANEADRHRQDRDLQGDHRAVEQLRQYLEGLIPVEGVAEHERPPFGRSNGAAIMATPSLKAIRLAIDAAHRQGRQCAADPLLVEFGVAARADLLVDEQVEIVDEAVFFTVGEERDVVRLERRLANHRDAGELAGLHGCLGNSRGGNGRVDLALAQRQEDVGLRLIGAKLAATPSLDLLFERDRFEGAGRRADGLALHAFEGLDARLVVGRDGHFEGEIGDAHAYGLCALQRIRGRSNADIDAAGHQRRNALGERRFDNLGGDAEHFGEIVAIVDVEADRIIVCVARAHGREVEHDGTAQRSRGNDVVQLVGLGRRDGGSGGQKAKCDDHFFH
ncbi:hypothetical protein RHSP_38222 [Rhizobium freirei PRF 81]|uniref:Uncharacterized protein n=1 Tax=Rhizobium freirei PRF 81 TaxID=363754 RepID=N6V4K5_9HYPH|nr:hypothetical protein RHSP_38222 [Rhizobium freirei PRF 81]